MINESLLEQKPLIDHVKGPAFPFRVLEAPVERYRFDTMLCSTTLCALHHIAEKLQAGSAPIFGQSKLPPGRNTEMHPPIEPGKIKADWRKPASILCPKRVEPPVDHCTVQDQMKSPRCDTLGSYNNLPIGVRLNREGGSFLILVQTACRHQFAAKIAHRLHHLCTFLSVFRHHPAHKIDL